MRRFLRRLRRNLFRLVPIMTRMTHRPDLGDAARRHAVAAAPVGPRGDRRVQGIADRLERRDAAVLHLVAAQIIEVGHERRDVRHGWTSQSTAVSILVTPP
jgi:hypothetical protein